MRATLSELEDVERRRAAELLAAQWGRVAGWVRARRGRDRALAVASFVGVRLEVDTAPLHRALLGGGDGLWLPRVVGPGVMRFARVPDAAALSALVRGPFGLREPSPVADALAEGEVSGIDVVLVPGLAFAEDGARLGQGGGFYDRCLGAPAAGEGARQGRPLAVGVGLDAQRLPAGQVPTETHDVRMDAVWTPLGLHVVGEGLVG